MALSDRRALELYREYAPYAILTESRRRPHHMMCGPRRDLTHSRLRRPIGHQCQLLRRATNAPVRLPTLAHVSVRVLQARPHVAPSFRFAPSSLLAANDRLHGWS